MMGQCRCLHTPIGHPKRMLGRPGLALRDYLVPGANIGIDNDRGRINQAVKFIDECFDLPGSQAAPLDIDGRQGAAPIRLMDKEPGLLLHVNIFIEEVIITEGDLVRQPATFRP